MTFDVIFYSIKKLRSLKSSKSAHKLMGQNEFNDFQRRSLFYLDICRRSYVLNNIF